MTDRHGSDCDCIVHDGPHWIYSQFVWKKKNQRLRDRADASHSSLGLIAYAREESMRLKDLIREMRNRRMTDVPEELRSHATDDPLTETSEVNNIE